ncbi:MAG: rhamnulose-1-phosphate aldolase [Spirochaetales bacterium]|nr:rhamnulose-1-phosphate aldolase [Spirochaetales bacterium]
MSVILNDLVKEEISKVSEVASYLFSKGWAERNGGNISINLTEIFTGLPESFDEFTYVSVANFPKEAANKVFFVTGTGKRLRELNKPEKVSCIIKFDDSASGYHIIWGGNNDPSFRPTSELISHVKIHLDKIAEGSDHRTIVHTHPIELICMTHYYRFNTDEQAFNFAIWSTLPEVRAFVPRGVGITPYTLPGSEALADLTVAALRSKDVAIWNLHGALATGRDAHEAFDFIDVANKGATIFLKCLASGFSPLGMSQENLDELVEVFGL